MMEGFFAGIVMTASAYGFYVLVCPVPAGPVTCFSVKRAVKAASRELREGR